MRASRIAQCPVSLAEAVDHDADAEVLKAPQRFASPEPRGLVDLHPEPGGKNPGPVEGPRDLVHKLG